MADITVMAFALIAGIMFVGFLGELIFRKFEIPGVLLLLITGFLLGPVFKVVNSGSMLSLQFIVGPLALLVVLFDAGMTLNIYTVIKQSLRPFLFGILMMAFTTVATGLITHFIFKFDLGVGLLLGLILSGGAPAITIALASKLKIPEDARTFILLEPSFTDVLCAVLVIAFTGILFSGASINARETGSNLLAIFSIGALVGAAAGVLWIVILKKIQSITEYSYVATLAVLIFTYVFVEYFNASGLVAVLLFGLMLGNRDEIASMLKLDAGNGEEAQKLKPFHAEISFLVRTFFFTYLGMIVAIPSTSAIEMSLVLMVGLYFARYAAVYISTIRSSLSKYNRLFSVFVDRGLSVAVLSTFPLAALTQINNPAFAAIKPQVALFPGIAFMILLLANVFSTIGVSIARPKEEEPREPGQEEPSIRIHQAHLKNHEEPSIKIQQNSEERFTEAERERVREAFRRTLKPKNNF